MRLGRNTSYEVSGLLTLKNTFIMKKIVKIYGLTLAVLSLVIELPFKLFVSAIYVILYPITKHMWGFEQYATKYKGGFIIGKTICRWFDL